ncbi:hypothetical protein COB57_01695 [Candidatus Peregrinibacteria bacterium]|nr:MAG: hypothetical protein COB57_01695 [Candidatus Peregrinibacteria bacterium]
METPKYKNFKPLHEIKVNDIPGFENGFIQEEDSLGSNWHISTPYFGDLLNDIYLNFNDQCSVVSEEDKEYIRESLSKIMSLMVSCFLSIEDTKEAKAFYQGLLVSQPWIDDRYHRERNGGVSSDIKQRFVTEFLFEVREQYNDKTDNTVENIRYGEGSINDQVKQVI